MSACIISPLHLFCLLHLVVIAATVHCAALSWFPSRSLIVLCSSLCWVLAPPLISAQAVNILNLFILTGRDTKRVLTDVNQTATLECHFQLNLKKRILLVSEVCLELLHLLCALHCGCPSTSYTKMKVFQYA